MTKDANLATLAPARFPSLFAPLRVEWAGMDARFTQGAPDPASVTKIHLVAFVGELIVVCRDSAGDWFLPGGTLEADESVEHCAARELREEAGGRLTGPLHHVGAFDCVSDQPAPYRPWQPHPRQAWLYATADVEIDSSPTNPEDGEDVVEVRTAPLAEAKSLLAPNRAWLGELVDLAVDLHLSLRAGNGAE